MARDAVRTFLAKFTADTSGLAKGAKDAEKALGDTEKAVTKSSSGMKSAFGGFAAGFAGAFSAQAIIGFGKQTLSAASDLEEAVNVTSLVFKDQAKGMDDFFKSAATTMGQSEAAARQAAGNVGGLLNNMGFARQESADWSKTLLTLSADMGSAFNKDPAQAIAAIGAGLRGESEPLKQFNVMLNDSTIKAKAMELGLYDGKGALDTNAKAQASLALIMAQTTDIQGDFVNTSGGAANAQRVQAARTEDLQAAIGTKLLPAYQSVLGFINDKLLPGLMSLIGGFERFAAWIAQNQTTLAVLGTGLGVIALGLAAVNLQQAIMAGGGFIKWITTLVSSTRIWVAAQAALNLVMSLNPIGIVILLLAALGAALYVAWTKSETFRDIVTGAWDKIKTAASTSWEWIKTKAIDPLVGGFQWVQEKAGSLRDGVVGVWNGLSETTGRIFATMVESIKTPFRNVFEWINSNVIGNLNKVTSVFGLTVPSLPGFMVGGWTGPGARDKLVGGVHADEFVVQKTSQRRMRAEHPGWLDYVNKWGTVPGYADGGLVGKMRGAVDFVGNIASNIIDAVKDPIGFVTDTLRKAASGIKMIAPGGIGEIMYAVLGKLLDSAASWVKGANTPPPGTPAHPGAPAGTGAWAAPLGGYRISAGFPTYPSGRSHTGVDLAVGRGAPIYAIGPGTVSKVAHLTSSYGNHVFVDHGGKIFSIYAHMLNTAAQVGQSVAARSLLGTVDSTGNSTGDHLHLEIRRGGSAVDPRGFLRGVGVALAAGGIVRRPTVALIGESGPEAVVPLGRGSVGTTVVNVTVNVPPTGNPVETGRAVVEAIRSYERAAGPAWRSSAVPA